MVLMSLEPLMLGVLRFRRRGITGILHRCCDSLWIGLSWIKSDDRAPAGQVHIARFDTPDPSRSAFDMRDAARTAHSIDR
jgi:hypothetical protein